MTTTEFPITDRALGTLACRFRGDLLRRGDPGYDEARRVWNGRIDRRPPLLARCTGAEDVVGAVRFARAQGLPVAVRGGGHAVAGHAMADDGIVDLSWMTEVRVDPAGRPARVDGGCLNAHLDRATQPYGLATTSGIVSHTGVTGLVLGGGSATSCAPSAWRWTTCSPARSSVPMGGGGSPAPAGTRTCSGCCGAAAGTSAW